ncbi:MAG TPA: hypothetical protein PK280_18495 [Planctomycetota bacterium]|nr:hypothetical protein [Planctomycetota bacterium]
MRSLAIVALLFIACLGCGARVIVVPEGEPVRLREPVKAKVWVADKDGREVPAVVVLPAGWWALADPGK